MLTTLAIWEASPPASGLANATLLATTVATVATRPTFLDVCRAIRVPPKIVAAYPMSSPTVVPDFALMSHGCESRFQRAARPSIKEVLFWHAWRRPKTLISQRVREGKTGYPFLAPTDTGSDV